MRKTLMPVELIRNPILLLAFGFGSGLAPKAPGTFGTLAAIPLYLAIVHYGPDYLLPITVVASVVGIGICGYAANYMGVHDHGGIVWDEIAGMLLTLCWVPFSWPVLLSGFILFRLFDILKPWPISWLDKHVSGGLGIMIDDLIAGLFAAGVLALLAVFEILPVA